MQGRGEEAGPEPEHREILATPPSMTTVPGKKCFGTVAAGRVITRGHTVSGVQVDLSIYLFYYLLLSIDLSNNYAHTYLPDHLLHNIGYSYNVLLHVCNGNSISKSSFDSRQPRLQLVHLEISQTLVARRVGTY